MRRLTRILPCAVWSLIVSVPVARAADAVATADSAAAPAPGSRTLYLVRHGLYDQDDPRDEATGQGLVPVGREQARLVGERLAALGVRYDALVTSPLTRARETAAIIAARLPGLVPAIEPDLAECTPPTWRDDVARSLAVGEADGCRDRLERAFGRLCVPSPHGDRHEILVCHGNVIRWLWCRALGVDPAAWLGMTIANCSLTVIQVRPDGSCKLFIFSDIGHLPLALQTWPGGAAAPWAAP
ncbi:MAG: histidine phosphatase family protein [Candidatus Krumholzibacteriia bacterium]